ncbi:MAG: hypothetical protein RR528_02500 [Angelakisella sp.]
MIHFSFAGVRWRAAFGFFALAAVFLFIDAGGFALAFLGAAALHELGHLLAMGFFGVPIRLVELRCSGLIIYRDDRHHTEFLQEVFILMAGAAANLLAAGLLYLLGGEGALHFSAANSALAIYHLMPVAGLDGGSLLVLFCSRALGCRRGTQVAAQLSILFCFAAIVALCMITVWYGFSAGTLLMTVLFVCALIAPPSH